MAVLRYTRAEKKSVSLLAALILTINLANLGFQTLRQHSGNHLSGISVTAVEEVPERIPVEINSADSLMLLGLYGIGPVFSSRIIRYRELLGGYYEVRQLLEVYGMDSVRLQGFASDIRIDTSQIRRINLRTVTFRDLLRHPYTDYDMVRAFVRFRDQQGPPASVRSAVEGAGWPDSISQRLLPYLSAGGGAEF